MNASASIRFLRRDVLKGLGALIVGFNIGPGDGPGRAVAAPSLRDPKVTNSWIVLGKDGDATVYLGKVELGQGNSTTLLQLVAEELDIEVSRVSAAAVDTAHSMNQGATVSSTSI
jgi:nicotinate dehydrogenase subunit B